jgi:hypothetical protein
MLVWQGAALCVEYIAHGSKLQKTEQPPFRARPFLPKQNRAAKSDTNKDADTQEDRQK